MLVFKRYQWRVYRCGASEVIPFIEPVIPTPYDDDANCDASQDKVQQINCKRCKLLRENEDDELSIPIQQTRYRPASIDDLSKQRINSWVAENIINRPNVDINTVQNDEERPASIDDLSKQRINSCVAANIINRPNVDNNNVQNDEEGRGMSSTKWEHERSLDNDEQTGKIDIGNEINDNSREKDTAKNQVHSSISNSYLITTQDHIPSQIQPTAKKRYPQRRCVLCKANGKPWDCRYYCKACFERPALCKSSCFNKFHCKLLITNQ